MGEIRKRWRIARAALLAGTILTTASAAPAATLNLTVTNVGGRAIDGLYLSLTATSDWGADQLNAVGLREGASFALSGIACPTGSIVAIAEDAAGCFLYRSLSCGGGNVTWTITNESSRDCGR